MKSFVIVYWVKILTSQSIYLSETKCWSLWPSSAVKAKWKLPNFTGFLLRNFFSLYWLQRPNLNSLYRAPTHEGFALTFWFGYYKWFLRSFECYADTNKHKSTGKYLFDIMLLRYTWYSYLDCLLLRMQLKFKERQCMLI